MLGLVVLITIERSLSDQIRENLVVARDELVAEHRANGLSSLRDLIRRENRVVGGLDYRLEAADGQVITATLPPVPRQEGYTTVDLAETAVGGDKEGKAIVLVTLLPDGHLLAVGKELQGVKQAREAVVDAFSTASLAVVWLALIGGAILNTMFLRRVHRMAEAAREVTTGDLSRRIPIAPPHDEFTWLAQTLNHMLDRTTALMEINRQIGSAIAHDLRSPLTRLLRRLELAQSREGDLSAHQEAVDGAIEDVNDILDTFNAILRIAEIESGTRRAAFRPVDVAGIARGLAETYAPVATDEAKELTASAEGELWIDGDRDLVVQLLANLIENAIRHTPAGVTIAIAVRAFEDVALVEVRDNGPGIPRQDRERVLQRFVRLDRSRSTPGSGLGLTLCNAIAELHEATLRLNDAAPGLVCSVRFPRSRKLR